MAYSGRTSTIVKLSMLCRISSSHDEDMPRALWALLAVTVTTLLFTACLTRLVEQAPAATPQSSADHRQGIFHYDRGLERLKQANYDNAVADIDKARRLIDPQLIHLYTDEMHQVYFQSGIAYYDTGLYDDAIRLFDKAIDVVASSSDYPAAYYQRGLSHYRKGSYRRAIADFDMLVGLEQDYPDAAHYRRLAQEELLE